MILTIKDYKKAYAILDGEWEEEVRPALEEIHELFEEMKMILGPYRTTATLCSIGIDPYSFFQFQKENLKNAVEYAKTPTGFFGFVQRSHQWNCILDLAPTGSPVTNMEDYHKGLLYWRNRVNGIKDGIREFYENGAKFLENYTSRLINDKLSPKANEQADEFLSAFGMTKKVPKVRITISVTDE